MRAVRFLTAPRTRTNAITANAVVPVARNTSNAISMLASSRNILPNVSNRMSIALNLEIDHAEHDEVADAHPAGRQHQAELGQALIPDAGVEIRHQEIDHQEHADRQRRQNQRRGAAFGGPRTDLAAHLEALGDPDRERG